MRRTVVATLALGSVLAWSSAWASPTTWNFAVELDGKSIGTHRFTLRDHGGHRELVSAARFRVTLLGIPVYRYSHDATEQWQGNCLTALRAHTDDNGQVSAVEAGPGANGALQVQRGGTTAALEGCVMSFAYWNPRILTQRRLLNAQTGAYEDVRLQPLPEASVRVHGVEVPARGFRITAAGKPIDLWYSKDDEWLALDTVVDGGRRMRYRQP
ncbi:MAG: DUF6134 family protein [Casimicrobiaceae bacterium]